MAYSMFIKYSNIKLKLDLVKLNLRLSNKKLKKQGSKSIKKNSCFHLSRSMNFYTSVIELYFFSMLSFQVMLTWFYVFQFTWSSILMCHKI